MAQPVEPRGSSFLTRLAIGVLVLVALWLVVGFVFSLLRSLVFLALIGLVVWIVLVGPPGGRRS
jgi:hypothetical protein